MILQVLTKSEYGFQSLEQVTEEKLRRHQTLDGDKSPDVSDTISHCFPEYADNSKSTSFALHRVRRVSHFTECAESRTSQSARSNQSRTSHGSKCAEKQELRTVQSARKTQIPMRTAPSARTSQTEIRTAQRTRNNKHNTMREVTLESRSTQ